MLKGTTIIELTDVHTGKKEVVEKHNMITNAVSNLFQPSLGHLTSGATLRDIPLSKVFGGLLLFDREIPEDATQLYAPSGAKLTGHGANGYVNTTTGVKMGTYNTVESSFDRSTKTFTQVWDFATHQGNGPIGAVCLTSIDAGYGAYGTDRVYATNIETNGHGNLSFEIFSGSKIFTQPGAKFDNTAPVVTGTNEYLFLFDPENDIVYYFKLVDATTIVINKYRMGVTNYSLFRNGTTLLIPVSTDEITLQLSTPLTGNTTYNYDHADNSLNIICLGGSNVAANASFCITKIDCGTFEVTQRLVYNTSGVAYEGRNGSQGNYSLSARFAFVHDGYVYTKNGKTIYKVNLENNSDTVAITFPTEVLEPELALNGVIYYQNRAYDNTTDARTYLLDSTNNNVKTSGNYALTLTRFKDNNSSRYKPSSCTPVKGNTMIYYAGLSGSFHNSNRNQKSADMFFVLANYLSTINNLGTPVQKTADKTMKIRYVIQELDSVRDTDMNTGM